MSMVIRSIDFPKGTELKIFSINDDYINIPVGTIGRVEYVDGKNGRIIVSLNHGRIISLNINEDVFEKGGTN